METLQFLTLIFESRIALLRSISNGSYEYEFAERQLRIIAVEYLELELDDKRIERLVETKGAE